MTREEEAIAEVTNRLFKQYQAIPDPDTQGRKKPTIEELTDFIKACNLYGAEHGLYTLSNVVELYPEFEEIARWVAGHWLLVKLLISLNDLELKIYDPPAPPPTFKRIKE